MKPIRLSWVGGRFIFGQIFVSLQFAVLSYEFWDRDILPCFSVNPLFLSCSVPFQFMICEIGDNLFQLLNFFLIYLYFNLVSFCDSFSWRKFISSPLSMQSLLMPLPLKKKKVILFLFPEQVKIWSNCIYFCIINVILLFNCVNVIVTRLKICVLQCQFRLWNLNRQLGFAQNL